MSSEERIATLTKAARRHASRDIATLIVDTALAYCGGVFPEDPEDVAELLENHLSTIGSLLLGSERGAELVSDAQALLAEHLPQGKKRTGLTTKAFTSSAFEAVLVVSNDAELTDALRRSVSRRVPVSSIPTHGVMDDALDATQLRSRFIVTDPPSRCPALERALLSGALGAKTLVLLRGADAAELEAAAKRAPRATFMRCAPDATYRDIAMLLPLGAPRANV